MPDVAVVVWGLGAMGSGIARLLLAKQGVRVCGAIERRPDVQDRDLADVLGVAPACGVKVQSDADAVLSRAGGKIVLLATGSFVRDIEPDILTAVRRGYNVISIAEEMSYPWYPSRDSAERIDKAAREAGVTVFGTGINPGFVLDLLVICLTGVCRRVDSIEARRVNDLSPFGPTVMRTQGVGATIEQFRAGSAGGEIVGHVGFQQSIRLIAGALGWELDRVEEKIEPIVSKVARRTPHATVEPGMVAGCNHTAVGYVEGRPAITLIHPQQICPDAEGVATGDYVRIHGDPELSFSGTPEIPGGIGTMAMAVNYVPHVMNARPGLLTLVDLPIPAARMGSMACAQPAER